MSTLVAESSVYSAEQANDGTFSIYNNSKDVIVTGGLPNYQLYIK